MKINIYNNAAELGKAAGMYAAQLILEAINTKGSANIILATGTSQFETLNQLLKEEIDWSKVTMFHLDEYIGLPITHAASFRKYLSERFISKVTAFKTVYLINGETNAGEECKRLNEVISAHPIDVALVGIGENGHLAFNDPPADFNTDEPYIIVTLDESCLKQQMSEGWFNSIEEVPKQAISMSIKQIMRSKQIICSVTDERKAVAVKNSVEQKVRNLYPASILQLHDDCTLYLDRSSSVLLSAKTIA